MASQRWKVTRFHRCSKSYWPYWLSRYYGGWFEPLIKSCADLLTWSNFFRFSSVWKWADGYRYTSFTYLNRPIWIDITMNPHSCIKQIRQIRRHHRFTVSFTMWKKQEVFFFWHLYKEANILKLHIFRVKITTCSFPHIGKSNLRIKE